MKDEIVSAGYHLHSLDTAVFVALHHAIGADTPVVVVKGKDVSIRKDFLEFFIVSGIFVPEDRYRATRHFALFYLAV